MRVLFVVFVVSIAALIWTLIAFRRHIRGHDTRPGEPLHITGTQHEDSLQQND